MESKLFRGSVWVLAGYGGSQALRLVGNLILWRLLYAEAFGLMAIVNVLMQGLAMFSDVGIGPSIVQSAHGDDPDYLNTAWTIQVLRGFALCIAGALIAVPVAKFYGEPQLASLVPVVALGAAISGFNSTRLFTVTRSIALGRLTLMDLIAQVVGLVVMIIWAFLHRNLWALVIGGLVSSVVRLVLSHTFLPGIRNRLQWDRASARTLARFGRWIFFSTLLTFAVAQSDRLIFGKFVPMAMLGVYSIATNWAGLPTSVLSRVFDSVIFPQLSRLHHSGSDFSGGFLKARAPWLLLAGLASACLIGGGPALIRLLYDDRAREAGWIVQVMGVGVWLLALENANGIALLALGKPKWVAAGSAAKLAGMAVLIPLGMTYFGFKGAVVGFSGSELLRYITSATGARRMRISGFAQDVLLTGLVGLTAGIGLLAARQLHPWVATNLALRPAKLAPLLECTGIGLSVSVGWACLYLYHRARQQTQSTP